MKTEGLPPAIVRLLDMLDAPSGRPWYGGPTFLGSVRGVDWRDALSKPNPPRHSIWELVLHVAYWKYAIRRHFAPDSEEGFGRSPSNWPTVPIAPDAKAWSSDQALLKQEHARLREAIAAFPPGRLDRIPPKAKKWTYAQLAYGIASHDAYHAAQVRLFKRMLKQRRA